MSSHKWFNVVMIVWAAVMCTLAVRDGRGVTWLAGFIWGGIVLFQVQQLRK